MKDEAVQTMGSCSKQGETAARQWETISKVLGSLVEVSSSPWTAEKTLGNLLGIFLGESAYPFGAVYVVDCHQEITLLAHRGFAGAGEAELASFFGERSLLHDVMTTGLPCGIDARDHDPIHRRRLRRAGVQSMVLFPLSTSGTPLGVLVFASPESRLSAVWLPRVESIARPVCQAILLVRAIGRIAHPARNALGKPKFAVPAVETANDGKTQTLSLRETVGYLCGMADAVASFAAAQAYERSMTLESNDDPRAICGPSGVTLAPELTPTAAGNSLDETAGSMNRGGARLIDLKNVPSVLPPSDAVVGGVAGVSVPGSGPSLSPGQPRYRRTLPYLFERIDDSLSAKDAWEDSNERSSEVRLRARALDPTGVDLVPESDG